MLGREKPKFQEARFFIWMAAISFLSLPIIWGASAVDQPLVIRMFIGATSAAVVAAGLIWALNDIGEQKKNDADAKPEKRPSVTIFKSEGGEVSGNRVHITTGGDVPQFSESRNTVVKNNDYSVAAKPEAIHGSYEIKGSIGYVGPQRENVTPNGDVKRLKGNRYREQDGSYRETGFLHIENGFTAKKVRLAIRAKTLTYCDLLLYNPDQKYRTLHTEVKNGAAIFVIENVVPDQYHVNMKLAEDDPWSVSFDVLEK
jgi:hypothetical protein